MSRNPEDVSFVILPRDRGIAYARWIYTHSIACAITEGYRPHIGRPCIVVDTAEWTKGTVRRIQCLPVDDQDIKQKEGW